MRSSETDHAAIAFARRHLERRAPQRRQTGHRLSAHSTRLRRRQNFSGSGTADEKVPTSMASSAMSRAADAVVASAPVTNCQIFLRPVIKGLRLDREIFARHLPGSRSKASTTNPRYSMRPPPEISTAWSYGTGVSEGFRQTGKNVVLSWALPVPIYTDHLPCPHRRVIFKERRGDNLNGTFAATIRIGQRGKNETRSAAAPIRAMQLRAV